MSEKVRKFSIGTKIYLFVILTVLVVAVGTAALTFYISADQIDNYFKRLAFNSAENFASFVDADFLAELKEVANSDEYQELHDKAEEEEDESIIQAYLTEKGLWDKYCEQRDLLWTYLKNMDDIKYLYIVEFGPPDSLYDMYLLDDYDNPITQTGYFEEREPEFYGVDSTKEIAPTINHGVWGWLCSAYAPVYAADGSLVCHVGCDVDMDNIMNERLNFLIYALVATLVLTALVLTGAILFTTRVVVKPLNKLTAETKKFRPAEDMSYEEAGVLNLNIRSHDEIKDIYDVIRSMQIDTIDHLNRMSAMHREKLEYISNLKKAEDDIKDKEQQIVRIGREAYRDALTGIGNKAAYNKKTDELNEMIKAGDAEFAILMADLNDLKKINDVYGHKAGDKYITGCCHIICEIYKHSPVFRIGGDEFVAILQHRDYENRYTLLDMAKNVFSERYEDTSAEPCNRYSVALGMAEYASDDNTVELVFKRADKSMYEDKMNFKAEHGSYR